MIKHWDLLSPQCAEDTYTRNSKFRTLWDAEYIAIWSTEWLRKVIRAFLQANATAHSANSAVDAVVEVFVEQITHLSPSDFFMDHAEGEVSVVILWKSYKQTSSMKFLLFPYSCFTWH
jgi:hypothetical protein